MLIIGLLLFAAAVTVGIDFAVLNNNAIDLEAFGQVWESNASVAFVAGVVTALVGAIAVAMLISIVAVVRESVAVDTLRVDGGLTNEPALLQMQADAIGAPVEQGLADATAAGAAALAAVGAGLLENVAAIADLVPTTKRVDPQRDDGWRVSEHEAWRQFVQLSVQL